MSEPRIEYRAISGLTPAPRNYRQHDIGAIVTSLKVNGFVAPIILDDRTGRIVAGHGRVAALMSMQKSGESPPERIKVDGGEWMAPVLVGVEFRDAKAAELYLISDNRISDLADNDQNVLAEMLKELAADDLLPGTGYDTDDLDALLKDLGNREDRGADDAAPEPIPNPVTKLGDLIVMGDHRLICGDSRVEDVVRKVLAGDVPVLMVTDPPYGVYLDPEWRVRDGINKPEQDNQVDRIAGDDHFKWSAAFKMSGAKVAYVWHGAMMTREAATELERAGYEIRDQVAWVRPHGFITRGAYQWRHDPCWYAVRKGENANWQGARDQDTVWESPSPRAAQTKSTDADPKADHPTQKPVILFATPMKNHTVPGDIVYEPFAGSGTAIIAAEQAGRHCRAVEISPAYCDVIVSRWEKFTGKQAVRSTPA